MGGTPKERITAFTAFAQDAIDAPEVAAAAARCRRATPARTAAACLDLVQALPYYPDPPGVDDWIGHPCHVLTVGGDCEDLATLLIALWATCGLTGRLQWITQGGEQDHVTAQVQLPGLGWLWGEPTVRGARLGEDPYAAAKRLQVSRGFPGAL